MTHRLFRLKILPIESAFPCSIQTWLTLMWGRETRLSSYMAIQLPLISGGILFLISYHLGVVSPRISSEWATQGSS